MVKVNLKSQNGRSMVEMLGVLGMKVSFSIRISSLKFVDAPLLMVSRVILKKGAFVV